MSGEFSFYCGLHGYFVSVVSDNPSTRPFLEGELGGFFQFADTDEITSRQEIIGQVICITDQGRFNQQKSRLASLNLSPFMMHNPNNTPLERREGAIGIDEFGIVYCHSITKRSVITADPTSNVIHVFNVDVENSNKEIRRVIRDQLLIRKLESCGSVVFHSACLARRKSAAALVIGSSGAGKTTFFLESISRPDIYFGMTCDTDSH